MRHPNWDLAESILSSILPGSTGYHPDRISGIPLDAWESFDLEHRDMDEIEKALLARCTELAGPVIVVNDTSYESGSGPYFVDAGHLPDFVKTFGDRVGDYFLNGGVIIASPVTGIVIVVQDDGFIAATHGRSVMKLVCDM